MGTDTQKMPIHVEHGPLADPPVPGAGPRVTSACGRTHRGCRRAENQDRLYVGEHVFAVADGIGGRRGGDVAAELALEPMAALDRACGGRADVESALREAVADAHEQVRARGDADPALEDMGTTLTVMALDDGVVHVAHVGDSRLYRVRAGVFEQLTSDHTLVQQLVDQGRLSPAEAEDHPNSNVITRAIGTRPRVDVDVSAFDLAEGDTFLLCSDGLPDALEEDRLTHALTTPASVTDAADDLIAEAIGAGVQDNVTALVVRYQYR